MRPQVRGSSRRNDQPRAPRRQAPQATTPPDRPRRPDRRAAPLLRERVRRHQPGGRPRQGSAACGQVILLGFRPPGDLRVASVCGVHVGDDRRAVDDDHGSAKPVQTKRSTVCSPRSSRAAKTPRARGLTMSEPLAADPEGCAYDLGLGYAFACGTQQEGYIDVGLDVGLVFFIEVVHRLPPGRATAGPWNQQSAHGRPRLLAALRRGRVWVRAAVSAATVAAAGVLRRSRPAGQARIIRGPDELRQRWPRAGAVAARGALATLARAPQRMPVRTAFHPAQL